MQSVRRSGLNLELGKIVEYGIAIAILIVLENRLDVIDINEIPLFAEFGTGKANLGGEVMAVDSPSGPGSGTVRKCCATNSRVTVNS